MEEFNFKKLRDTTLALCEGVDSDEAIKAVATALGILLAERGATAVALDYPGMRITVNIEAN